MKKNMRFCMLLTEYWSGPSSSWNRLRKTKDIQRCFKQIQVPRELRSLGSWLRKSQRGTAFCHCPARIWCPDRLSCVSLWSVYGSELMPGPQITIHNRGVLIPAEPDFSQNSVESSLISMIDFSEMKSPINKRSKAGKTSYFSSLDPIFLARMDGFEF